ncbi:phage tail protein I [Pseudomonas aeruginosa]|uniref:phage tail protein I n=1 Tax=Pseudomonas aeruginosa TaxID=287 RepID=UPI003D6EB072
MTVEQRAWPESARRGAIRSAFFIHSRKGTIGALRRVVEPLGTLIEVSSRAAGAGLHP